MGEQCGNIHHRVIAVILKSKQKTSLVFSKWGDARFTALRMRPVFCSLVQICRYSGEQTYQ